MIKVVEQNFFDLLPWQQTRQKGLVVLNPPYGRRLGSAREKDQDYKEIMDKLKKDFKGWRVAMLVPGSKAGRRLPAHWRREVIYHGGLHVNLLVGVV